MNPGIRRAAWLTGAVLLVAASLAPATDLDQASSRVGFELRTRWGQVLHGRFQTLEGEVQVLPDGRRQARLQLSTGDVEIADHPGYTRFARGGGFFDAEHWPTVSFVSDPYPEALLHEGGTVAGMLTIRGIARKQRFTIAPAGCARPGLDCDVVAGGVINRNHYGMGRWRIAIRDEVLFSLRLRFTDGAA